MISWEMMVFTISMAISQGGVMKIKTGAKKRIYNKLPSKDLKHKSKKLFKEGSLYNLNAKLVPFGIIIAYNHIHVQTFSSSSLFFLCECLYYVDQWPADYDPLIFAFSTLCIHEYFSKKKQNKTKYRLLLCYWIFLYCVIKYFNICLYRHAFLDHAEE